MMWLKKIFGSLKDPQAADPESGPLAGAISQLSFEAAEAAAFKLLHDPRFFETTQEEPDGQVGVPVCYNKLSLPDRSYQARFQDLTLGFIGRPKWLRDGQLPGATILGSMGEVGFIVCYAGKAPRVEIVDNSSLEILDEAESLYHLLLSEASSVDTVAVETAIQSHA